MTFLTPTGNMFAGNFKVNIVFGCVAGVHFLKFEWVEVYIMSKAF